MDTSDHSRNPPDQPPSSATTNGSLANVVSRGAPGGSSMIMAVTPFNPSPQTPRGIELAAKLRANYTLHGCLKAAPRMLRQDSSSPTSPQTPIVSQPSSPTDTSSSYL